MMGLILLLATVGFLASLYGWYVENEVQKNPTYKPVCDINKTISCMATIKSPYFRMFYISNHIIGMIFYAILFFVALMHNIMLIKYLAAAAMIPTAILSYILYAKIKVACPICITVYAINIVLFIVSYFL